MKIKKNILIGLACIFLFVIACGQNESNSEANVALIQIEEQIIELQTRIDAIIIQDIELNEKLDEIKAKTEVNPSETPIESQLIFKILVLQRDYATSILRTRNGDMTIEEFDAKISSLVFGHPILQSAWDSAASGTIAIESFELLMWSITFDAFIGYLRQ